MRIHLGRHHAVIRKLQQLQLMGILTLELELGVRGGEPPPDIQIQVIRQPRLLSIRHRAHNVEIPPLPTRAPFMNYITPIWFSLYR